MGAEGEVLVVRADGRRQFVPGLLPDERALVAGEGERGRVVELLEASPERVEPPCPHFGRCGGCAFQHWAEAPARAFKIEALRALLDRAGLRAPFRPAFHARPGERRRVALHARRSGGPRPLLGFKGRRDWGVVPLETCVVADTEIVAALGPLAELSSAFLKAPKSAPSLLVTKTLGGLAVDVSGVEGGARGLSADERAGLAEAAETRGLARLSLGGEILYAPRPAMVSHGGVLAALPPGGFLQAVERAEAFMAALAAEALSDCARVADLFCGSGAFALPLARQASVLACDSAGDAVAALAAAAGGARGLKALRAEVRDLYRRPLLARELADIEGVVMDPPRAGAPQQAAELAASRVRALVYVSCNPTTFARDAAALAAGGFALQWVAPVDQFLWSPHMELVGVFRR
jgi:23S rRNA (uracil1939-C5)-methyltransferase